MKFDNFNKIGDTTYRVKNQIKAYINFAQWYTDFWRQNQKFPNDVDFRLWVRQCKNPYNYSEQGNDKIKDRLSFVLNNAIHKYKLIKKNSNDCSFNLLCNNDCYKEILNKLAEPNGCDNDSCTAFRAMLEFMVKFPKFNDAKKIAFAFFVFEKGDDFCSLYNCTITDLINKMFGRYTAQEIISHSFFMKKPAKMKQICKKILKKTMSFVISNDEFEYLVKNKHISNTINLKSEFESFIKENSFDRIVEFFLVTRFTKLFYGDYFDLFNRVMYGLNLSNSYGRNVSYYNNNALHFNAQKDCFYVEQKNNGKLPYSYDEINTHLQKINDRDFSFIEKDIHLDGVPAYTIAEYFVNLKICMLFKVPISRIKEYVNTILDKNLYPICHAPGGRSDMCFLHNKILLGFETTTHATQRNIIINELYQCFEHLANHKPPCNQNILFLFLPQATSFIKNTFISQANVWTNTTKRKFSAKILTFNELLNIHKPEQILSFD